MAGEQDAIHVEGFALEPIGGGVNRNNGGYRRHLLGLDLDADAPVLRDRQQMIDHIEPARTVRVVDPANVDENRERTFGVIAQIGQHADDIVGFRG